jgi:hypothetical protein
VAKWGHLTQELALSVILGEPSSFLIAHHNYIYNRGAIFFTLRMRNYLTSIVDIPPTASSTCA